MTKHPPRVPSFVAFAVVAALATASSAIAFSGGITSLSFSANGGCNDCHSGGQVPTVTLTGPQGVLPDSLNEYTLTVSAPGAQDLGGLNVSIADGVLSTGGADSANTQAVSGAGGLDEITHTSPKMSSGGVTTFTFLWTAPSTFSTLTLSGWGNAVNGNVSTTGDRAAHATLNVFNQSAPTDVPTPTPTPAPTPTDRLADPIKRPIRHGSAKVALVPVASGFDAPIAARGAPGIDARYLYVVDQSGIWWRVDTTNGSKTVFLDVTSRLVPLGIFGPGTYDERGFLGAAFANDYATSGLVYTYTSEPATPNPDFSTMPPMTSPDCQSVVTEWHVINPTDSSAVVDTGSAREVLRFDKPQFNHNGGDLHFGPVDNYLYVSTGDGGGADDQDDQPFIGPPTVGHGPNGNGQNRGVILGKILRIDPRGNNSANGEYGIPADNPFVGMPGTLGEIWAYGFRNPHRYSFDVPTGALYVGDVGQNDVEEVDVVVKGGNYGWRLKEGGFFFRPNGPAAGYVSKIDQGVPADLIDPVAQYDHGEGISVIGGYVSYSPSLPKLKEHYVFGEFAKSFANNGRLFYLKKRHLLKTNGKIQKSMIAEVKYVSGDSLGISLNSIGEGNDKELYALGDTTAAPAGGTGVVLRIVEP